MIDWCMRAGASRSVLFVMPPGGAVHAFVEHLGTAFLRTLLARAGIASEQYLPPANVPLAGFAAHLRDARPRLVGFTAYESNLTACRLMAQVVRDTLPDAVVAVGGPNATFSPAETLDLVGADVCLRGAGEGTIVQLAEAVLGARAPRRRLADLLARLPNLALRAPGAPMLTRTGDLSSFPRDHFRRLDDVPSPYQAGFVTSADTGLLTARGCNQHCTYCSFASISGRRMVSHGVERVLDDVAALKSVAAKGASRRKFIPIVDDTFTLAPERARAICDGIASRGLALPFHCATRADRVDAGLLRAMRRAGFVGVSFGLESAVPRVLRAMGKVQDPATGDDPTFEAERAYLAQVRSAVAAARRAGLTPSVSVIGGMPGESADDFRATLALVAELGVRSYAHNVLALMPGTPLHRDRDRHGVHAGRDPVTGEWRTAHAYDVSSVAPLESASTATAGWDEAHDLSDALCGRARHDRASAEGAWAVVLHADEVSPRVAAWLPEVLAIHGTIAVVSRARGNAAARCAAGARALNEAGVPFGRLALLVPDDAAGGPLVLRSAGTLRAHRFVLDAAWRPGRGVETNGGAGDCRVNVWIASAPGVRPAAAPAARPFASSVQIADGCRFWSRWPRCRRPRVLHVWDDGAVRPCWHGPVVGQVGDRFEDLAVRAERAATRGRCPLAARGVDRGTSAAAESHEVASQLAWSFRGSAGWREPRTV